MKNLQKLDDFRKLGKDSLVEEMMKGTIKGGCCTVTNASGPIEDVDFEENDTGEIIFED